MNSHSMTPSSGDRIARKAVTRDGMLAIMSERQTQAYLMARDVVRRVQRAAPLFDAISRRGADDFGWSQGDGYQGR